MPSFPVSKSITIQAAPEKIYSVISDLTYWREWSPWLISEPGATVNLKPGGKEYSWEGKRTGTGVLSVVKEQAPQRVDLFIQFLKPWKSTAPVWFELKAQGQATEVTWGMTGSLPFFMFFMTKMMAAYIGMDYTRGLLMLKDYVETGAVQSKLAFKGIQAFPGGRYVGIRTACTMSSLSGTMADDFGRLTAWAKENAGQVAGPPFSIYHTWDVIKGKVEYTSGFPVKEIPGQLPAGFVSGSIPQTNVNTITHTGSYKHLGNAWTTQYAMQRAKEFKYRKGIDPFEVYMNMPGEVRDEELLTEVHFPVA